MHPPDWEALRQFVATFCVTLAITLPISAIILKDWNTKK